MEALESRPKSAAVTGEYCEDCAAASVNFFNRLAAQPCFLISTIRATDTKEEAAGSKASSQSRQQSTGKADAEETDSSGAVGKAQRGNAKTAATDTGGAESGASGSAKKASAAVSDNTALERDSASAKRDSASPSLKKQAFQEVNVQKVKTRADGQLTQGLAAADDVITDGKASAGSAAAKEKPLDRAAAAKAADRLGSTAGSQKTASDEQADSESVEGSSEREESGEAAIEGVGAARLHAAKG